jgi:hypothetical protein
MSVLLSKASVLKVVSHSCSINYYKNNSKIKTEGGEMERGD